MHEHESFTDGCFACKIQHINIAPSATPSRNDGAWAARTKKMDKVWDADNCAYERLVHNGTQPKQIDGCAALEARAAIREEIETGLVAPDKQKREQLREMVDISNHMQPIPEGSVH